MERSTDMVFDPLRKREVARTPEEEVRQWFIGVLSQRMKVPMHMMMSEVGFKFGGKQFRADIVVYDRNAAPLVVVECKRPEVNLDARVLEQAVRYNMVLDVRYIIITNGLKTFVCRRGTGDSGSSFELMDNLPQWSGMLGAPMENK